MRNRDYSLQSEILSVEGKSVPLYSKEGSFSDALK